MTTTTAKTANTNKTPAAATKTKKGGDNTTTTTTTTTPTPTPETTPKRNSAFYGGLDQMRDKDILKSTLETLHTLTKIVATDEPRGFDMLYVNLPWKTVSMEYAAKLPMAQLVDGKDNAGMLLWVDSPCVDKATTLLNTWGFKFHSVLHVTSYVNPPPPVPVPAAAPASTEVLASAADAGAGAETTTTTGTDVGAATIPATTISTTSNRKALVPHGWMVDGIVPSKSRQLWFAVKGTDPSAYLKDSSFIRKRLQACSTFVYTKTVDTAATTLSSKKKNLDNWVVFPELDAYVPPELGAALETIHKPAARVLSLFADTLNRSWYTWGPNVPGYVAGPLRPDGGGFPVVHALLKYFGAMKNVTVQKYMTLMNLYAVQYAKQLGNVASPTKEVGEDGLPKQYLTPLVTGRMHDFLTDLVRKYTEGGGVPKESPLAAASVVPLDRLPQFSTLMATTQTQVLLLVTQVIRWVLSKNAEATERRKRAIKRKRELSAETETEAEDGAAKQPRAPRKFGIAAPVDVSKDLAEFMGLGEGEQVARTTVVKFVNEYIGKHKLQNPEKKSEIKCDAKLQALLNPGENFGPVTYFNLCKLLGPHFSSAAGKAAGAKRKCPTGAKGAPGPAGVVDAPLPPPPSGPVPPSQPPPSRPRAVGGTRA